MCNQDLIIKLHMNKINNNDIKQFLTDLFDENNGCDEITLECVKYYESIINNFGVKIKKCNIMDYLCEKNCWSTLKYLIKKYKLTFKNNNINQTCANLLDCMRDDFYYGEGRCLDSTKINELSKIAVYLEPHYVLEHFQEFAKKWNEDNENMNVDIDEIFDESLTKAKWKD